MVTNKAIASQISQIKHFFHCILVVVCPNSSMYLIMSGSGQSIRNSGVVGHVVGVFLCFLLPPVLPGGPHGHDDHDQVEALGPPHAQVFLAVGQQGLAKRGEPAESR